MIHISRQGQRPKKTAENAAKGLSSGKSKASVSHKNSTKGEKKCPGDETSNCNLKLPVMDGNGDNPPSVFKPDAAAWNMLAPFMRPVAYSNDSALARIASQDPGQNIQPNLIAASMPSPTNLLADQRLMLLQQMQLGNHHPQNSLSFAGHHDHNAIFQGNILAALESSMAFPQGNPLLATQAQSHAMRNFLQPQPQTLTTQALVEQFRQLEKKKLELDALKQGHTGLQQGIIPGAQFDVHQERPRNVSAGLDKSGEAQAQSRLKKKKKAHLLGCVHVDSDSGVVNHPVKANAKKRNVDVNEISFGDAKLKKAKQDESTSNQSVQEIPKPPLAKPSFQNQVFDSDINFVGTLTKVLQDNHSHDILKHHHGLQALIRQLIALSIARRSFDLLSKASDLALKFGLTMNRILCGVDDIDAVSSGDVIGSPMNYLLSMLLESHPAQARHSAGNVFVPNLPRSLLSCIAPSSCSSFGELDVGNRWIVIREACAGITNVYCSPMFEKRVVSSSQLSQLDDGMTGVFSSLFTKEMYKRLVSKVAEQISLNVTGTEIQVFSVHEPSKICLHNWENSTSQTNVFEKIMSGTVQHDGVMAIDIDIMFSSIQTMDKHWVS